MSVVNAFFLFFYLCVWKCLPWKWYLSLFFPLTRNWTFNIWNLLVSCWNSFGAAGLKQWNGLLSTRYCWGIWCTHLCLSSQVVKLRLATLSEFPKEDKTLQTPRDHEPAYALHSSSSLCLQSNPVCSPPVTLPLGNSLQPEPWCEESSAQCVSSQPSRTYGSVCFISEMFLCAFALLWLAQGERKQFFTGGKTATCEN